MKRETVSEPQRENGQAIMEFSLILIVLMLLIFGIIEGARVLQAWVTVQNAARQAGRYAITGNYDPAFSSCVADDPGCDPRVPSIKQVAYRASAGLGINPNAGFGQPRYHMVEVFGLNGADEWVAESAGDPGRPVMVRVSFQVPLVTPLLQALTRSLRLTGQVTLNNEFFNQIYNSRAESPPPSLPAPPAPRTPVADLQIEKSASAAVVERDEQFSYSLLVTNLGPNEARGIQVIDTLPPDVILVSAPAICSQADRTITCRPDNLPRGANHTIDLVVQAPSVLPLPDGQMENQVQVLGAEQDDNPANDADSVTTLVVAASTDADLALAGLSAQPDPVVVRQALRYQATVRNNGVAEATNITLTGDVPAGAGFVSASASQGSCGEADGRITCNLGALARNAAATVELQIRAPADPGSVQMTLNATADEADPLPGNNFGTVETTVVPETSDLFVVMAASPDPVPVAEELIYNIRVGNSGPADADNANLTLVLSESVSVVEMTLDKGSCSVTGFIVFCELGTVPLTTGLEVQVAVLPEVQGTISAQAAVSAEQDDPVGDNNNVTASVTVAGSADIQVTLSDDPSTPPGISAGDILSYDIEVVNNGPTTATGVRVVNSMPPESGYLGVLTSQGGCSRSGPTVRCGLGNLRPGESAQIGIQVIPEQEGVIYNSVTVASNQFDANPVNNYAQAATTVFPALNPFVTLDPVCGLPGTPFTIEGFSWPSNGNQDVDVFWSEEKPANLLGTVESNGRVWSLAATAPDNAPFGEYTIQAVRRGIIAEATFTVPCPAPNLVVGQPELIADGPVEAWTPVSFRATVENIGSLDALSQYFIGLYFDPSPAPDGTTTHLPEAQRVELVAISGLDLSTSRVITITAEAGFTEAGLHDVYLVVDSDPGPTGVIEEQIETDNVSPLLQLGVLPGEPPPTPTPGPSPTPDPDPPGRFAGQAFLIAAGGQMVPQPGVKVKVFEAASGALQAFTYTDFEGSYFLDGLNPGTYTLSACIVIDGSNYSYAVAGVAINSDEVTIEDLYLEAGPCG